MARNLDLSVILKAVDKATGPLKNVAQGSSKTAQAIKASKNELGELKTAQRNLRSFGQLSQKSSEASEALRAQQERVAKLTREIEQSDKPSKRMNERRDAAIRKAQKLKKQVNEHAEALERSRREMRSNGRVARGLVDQMARGEDTTQAMTRAEKQLERQMGRTNKSIERQQDRLKRLGKLKQQGIAARTSGGQFAQSAGAAGRRLAIGGSLVGGGIALGGHSFAQRTENTRQWSARLGVAADELSRLEFVGQRYGVQQQAMIDGLKELSLRADEFVTTGKGESAEAFERLGFSQKGLEDATKNTSELFDTVMRRLRQVKDVGARQRIVDEIFGGSAGEQLTEMATASRKEIMRLKREADALGVTLSKEDIKAAREYTEAMYGAQGALRGVHHTLGRELAPVLTDVFKELKAWIAANRGAIKEFAKEFGSNLKAAVPVLVDLASGAATFARTLGSLIQTVARLVGGMDNLAMIAGVLFVGKPIIAAAAFLKTLWGLGSAALAFVGASGSIIGALKAIGLALAANPIGLVVTAIAGGAALIIANWDKLKPYFEALWEGIKSVFAGGWEGIKTLFSWSPLGLIRKVWGPVMDFFSGIWRGLKTLFSWNPLEVIRQAWGPVASFFSGVWDGIKSVFAGGWEGIKTLFSWSPLNLIRKSWGPVMDFFSGLWDKIGGLWNQLFGDDEGNAKEKMRRAGRTARRAAGGAAIGASVAASPAAADVPIDRRPPVKSERADGGFSIGKVEITVQAAPGMDEEAIARKVRAELEALEHERSARRNSRLYDEE